MKISTQYKSLISFIFIVISVGLLTACQQPKTETSNLRPANIADSWQLAPNKSTLSFITTKNKVINEEHTLAFEEGRLEQLKFAASIDLNSIDTQIDIRDQRMRDILFQTESNPVATINSILPKGLTVGQTVELPFTLMLNKQQKTYTSKVLIQMVEDALVVTNYDPININGKDFELDGAINQLTQLAGLQGINYDVLVDFKLTFEK